MFYPILDDVIVVHACRFLSLRQQKDVKCFSKAFLEQFQNN